MTTYNTGNPVPSADARDRYDNSQTLDEVITGPFTYYANRIGNNVLSLKGMEILFNASQEYRESAFQVFLEGSGWSSIGAYTAGVIITSHAQTVDYLGQPYQLKPSIPASISNPYTVTGNWAAESQNFKLVGDNSLRQELAGPNGSDLIGCKLSLTGSIQRSITQRLEDYISAKDFGAFGDGTFHPLSERFSSIASAQAFYPNVPITALTNGLDWAAAWQADYVASQTQKKVFFPAGRYPFDRTCLKTTTWVGEGVANAWNFDFKGSLITPYGPGNPARWTDVDGSDTADYTPLIVDGTSGSGFEKMTISCRPDQERWSCGVFFAGVRRKFMRDTDVTGYWKDAGVRIDATWSNINSTLLALHPEVTSDAGCNEYAFSNCFFTGLRGLRIQGTTRSSATLPFVWGPGGTSDISIAWCRIGSEGPDAEKLANGAGFWHDAVIPNSAGAGQGINFINSTIRVSAKYCMYLDHSNRIQMANTYAETISSWSSTYGPAINAMTSATSQISLLNDANGQRWHKDGVLVGNNASINQWQASRAISKWRADGSLATPHFYGSFEGQTGTLITSSANLGLISFRYDDGNTATPYAHLTNVSLRPDVASGISLGTTGFPFSTGNINDVRVSTALRPTTDNTVSCGTASFRWSTVFAGTGPINTSDERKKTPVRSLFASELSAGFRLSQEIGAFQWKESIASKGEEAARLHIGMTVQRAITVMLEEGLDPYRYGLICFDQWEEARETVEATYKGTGLFDGEGHEILEIDVPEHEIVIREAGELYGFREGALHALMIKGAVHSLLARIEELESKI